MNTAKAALLYMCGLGVWAGTLAQSTTSREAGRSAAQQAIESYGTEAALQESGKAINTDAPMTTASGQTFDGRIACEAASEFLRVTILPSATNDIDQFVMELDTDLNGSFDRQQLYPGPISGICNNGVVRCDAGSFNNCQYLQWSTTSGTVDLVPVAPSALGACYCMNNSCGNNLLWTNRTKVLSDLTTAIARSVLTLNPRLNLGKAEPVDEVSMRMFGGRTSCLTDSTPEQYYRNPTNMASDGAAITSTPGTVPYLVMNSPVASEHAQSVVPCTISRTITAESLTESDILRLLDRTFGSTTSCGPGCIRYSLGDGTDNVRSGGRCTLFEDRQRTEVRRGDRITSARLVYARLDDYLQVRTQGALSYTSDPSWTTTTVPAPRCERGRDFNNVLNIDLTSHFRAGGIVETLLLNAVSGEGQARIDMEVRFEEGCAVEPDLISNGCAALEANTACGLESEIVDGVQTVRNHLTTGLSPLPSSRPLGAGSCASEVATRDWWFTERRYTCPASTSTYDLSTAEERYRTVHSSFDPASGNFNDRRVDANGTATISSELTALPQPDTPEPCQMTCRTRRPRPGAEVGGGLNRSALNQTGVAYDFTFRECTTDNLCPAQVDEEIVSACDCRSNFAQAAAMMQTIRMVKEDMACAPPP